jgi:hypothetical protein
MEETWSHVVRRRCPLARIIEFEIAQTLQNGAVLEEREREIRRELIKAARRRERQIRCRRVAKLTLCTR